MVQPCIYCCSWRSESTAQRVSKGVGSKGMERRHQAETPLPKERPCDKPWFRMRVKRGSPTSRLSPLPHPNRRRVEGGDPRRCAAGGKLIPVDLRQGCVHGHATRMTFLHTLGMQLKPQREAPPRRRVALSCCSILKEGSPGDGQFVA